MQRVMPGDVAKVAAHGGTCELRAQPRPVCGFDIGSTISASTVCPTDGFVYGSIVSALELSGGSRGGSAGRPVNVFDVSFTGLGPLFWSLKWICGQFYSSCTSH